MKYVIIGNCIAAAGAVEGIRSMDPSGDIIIIDGEKHGSYTRPLITYFLGHPEQYTNLSYRDKAFFAAHQVKVIAGLAVGINPSAQQVDLENGQSVYYDRLLLATGAAPVIPSLPGIDLDWVQTLYTLDDARRIDAMIGPGKRAVIVGSGLIGIKTAEALVHRGLEISVIERESHALPRLLDEAAAQWIHRHLESHGIKVLCNEEVVSISPDGMVELKTGLQLPADLVIIAVGTRPNLALAAACGMDLGRGIKVNSRMQTSDPHIYAAGDVIESPELQTGGSEIMALLPHAHREGFLAGLNMAGGLCQHPGGIFMNSVKIMGWNICAAGHPSALGETFTWQQGEQRLALTVQDNILQRYIAVNFPEIAGPLTAMIEHRITATREEWQNVVNEKPSLATIPAVYWTETRRWQDDGSLKCG